MGSDAPYVIMPLLLLINILIILLTEFTVICPHMCYNIYCGYSFAIWLPSLSVKCIRGSSMLLSALTVGSLLLLDGVLLLLNGVLLLLDGVLL